MYNNGSDLARHAPRDGNELLPISDRAVDEDQSPLRTLAPRSWSRQTP
jgi:hypothetical protein